MWLNFFKRNKINTQTMKIIISTIIAVLFLTSCSNQRYGAISKVKHHPKTDNQTSNETSKKTEMVVTNSHQKLDINLPILEENSLIPIEIQKQETSSKADLSNKGNKTDKIASTLHSFVAPFIPQSNSKIQKLTERKISQKDQNTTETQAARGWFYYIIVGLLFLLLAFFFPNTLIGWIFYVIALIAFIYGFLALIDIV